MPPKKGKTKGEEKEKEAPVVDPDKVTEVDRTQYEIQILALDRKFKRISELVDGKRTLRQELAEKLDNLEKEKHRSIRFLNDKLIKKTEEADDVAEHLDGARREFESTIKGLVDKVDQQRMTFETSKVGLTNQISAYDNEITSLKHFQTIRNEMEEKEQNLAAEVQAQKAAFQADLDLLAKQDENDLIRLRGEMIRQVNSTAAEFRHSTDELIPPTIKRAIRENHGFRLTLRKLNRCKRHLDDEAGDVYDKMDGMNEKLDSLHLTEKDLAEQSHNKSFLINLLNKKVKATKLKLNELREHGENVEIKKNELRKIQDQLLAQNEEIDKLTTEEERLQVILDDKQDKLGIIEDETMNLKPILKSCVADLLKSSKISKASFTRLANSLGEGGDINEEYLNIPVGSLEPIC